MRKILLSFVIVLAACNDSPTDIVTPHDVSGSYVVRSLTYQGKTATIDTMYFRLSNNVMSGEARAYQQVNGGALIVANARLDGPYTTNGDFIVPTLADGNTANQWLQRASWLWNGGDTIRVIAFEVEGVAVRVH